MQNKIVNIISKVSRIDIEEINNKLSEDRTWDSFAHIEIVIALEEEFGITFAQEEIAQINTPQKIIEIVTKKVKDL